MKKWIYRHRQTNRVAHVWYQDLAPAEEFLRAFGSPSDFELIEVGNLPLAERVEVVRMRRAPLYPPITELADALFHAQLGNTTQLDAYYAACEAVKEAHPIPTE